MKRLGMVVLLVSAVLVVCASFAAAWPAGSSCAMAEAFDYKAGSYNILCAWDLMTGWIT